MEALFVSVVIPCSYHIPEEEHWIAIEMNLYHMSHNINKDNITVGSVRLNYSIVS